MGIRALGHRQGATSLLPGVLLRSRGLLLGSLGRPDALVGVPWRSLGVLSVLFLCFLVDLSMSALFLCYEGWGAMHDPYTPVHVL